jgi:hypothetical protein
VGKRSRQRARGAGGHESQPDELPGSPYTDAAGNELVLRAVLTPKSRTRYTSTLHGGAHQEDAWQRAAELLFELLTTSWTINGVATTQPGELLARYRIATVPERQFVRDSLREHLAEHFPELESP